MIVRIKHDGDTLRLVWKFTLEFLQFPASNSMLFNEDIPIERWFALESYTRRSIKKFSNWQSLLEAVLPGVSTGLPIPRTSEGVDVCRLERLVG
jgi:hypothetical protein